MKCKLLLALALLCTSIQAYCQIQVTGTVLDANGSPLPGATVTLDNQTDNFGTISDTKGEFSFSLKELQEVSIHELRIGISSMLQESASYTLPITAEELLKIKTGVIKKLEKNKTAIIGMAVKQIANKHR